MRALQNWVDRFSREHPRFGIPHLINYLLAGNVLVYLLDMFSDGAATALLGLDFSMAVLSHEFWRFLTFVFVPDSSRPLWFMVSLFFYYFLGNTMEAEWGTAKFTLFYIFGAVLTYLASIVTYFWTGGVINYMITLSSVHSTLFLAFATLFPDEYIRVYFILPVKAKWLALFYVFIDVWQIIFQYRFILFFILPLVLPVKIASLLNYALFFWDELVTFFRRALGRARHQNSRQTINFKKAVKSEYKKKGYIHKCAVCGKTDTDNPGMEFRYCSKCNGYYCYCMDHINNHTHITGPEGGSKAERAAAYNDPFTLARGTRQD